MADSDQLSTIFNALADPTRRQMLARLAGGEMTVAELSQPFDLSAPAISKHLKVLERAGLIERGRNAQWRPCRLRVAPLRQTAEWIEQYRTIWEERADRPEASPREPQKSETDQIGQAGIDESHW